MAYESTDPSIAGRLRSARWLIGAGYVAPTLGFLIGDVLPRGSDELGIATSMTALVLGLVIGGALLLLGLAKGIQALVRMRDRFRWFDYLILAAGVAPFAVVVAGALLSN